MWMRIDKKLRECVEHPLERGACFLCARVADTVEHVIPLWLLHHCNLFGRTFTAENKTTIPCEKVTIDCCKKCNSQQLAKLEKTVSKAFKDGFAAANALPRGLLYQWAAKIFVGLAYKGLFLKADRKLKGSKSLVSTNEMGNYRLLWYWLRLGWDMERHPPPGSLWVFECLSIKDEEFDLQVWHDPPMLGIRAYDVGVIVNFLDGRVFQDHCKDANVEPQIRLLKLAPIQFAEVFVRFAYRASCLEFTVRVEPASADGREELRLIPWPPGAITKFAPWDEGEYARHLSTRIGVPVNGILQPNGKTISSLWNHEGRLLQHFGTGVPPSLRPPLKARGPSRKRD